MIKLSDFRLEREMIFEDAELKETLRNQKLDLEKIHFNKFGKEVVENFNKIAKSYKNGLSNEELLFVVVGILTDVEVDINYNEFLEMLDDYENTELISFCNVVIEKLSKVMRNAKITNNNIENIKLETNKIDDIMSKLKVVK